MELAETGSKSTSEELKIFNFSGGGMPPDPSSKCVLCTHIIHKHNYLNMLVVPMLDLAILVRSNGMRVPQRGESGNDTTGKNLSTFYLLPTGLLS